MSGSDSAITTTAVAARTAGSAAGSVAIAPAVPSGRRVVLYSVRRFGDATVENVADDLGITVSGARQHLSSLAESGLVETSEVDRGPGQRGRPRLTYHVTELGDTLFPNAYGALTNELLGYVADDDPGAVERLFQRRRDHRIAAARARVDQYTELADRVAELARVLDDDGYLATSQQVGTGRFVVTEHNCAIAAVSKRYNQACDSELEFIRSVLADASVTRISHMVSGDRRCAYEIIGPAPASAS